MEFFVILVGLVVIVGVVRAVKKQREKAERERRLQEQTERKRVQACGEIVRHFANHFGYLARQCISREELESLINSGICSKDLAREIERRMADKQGLVLGYQPAGEGQKPDVKLTQEFRDRHVYVIGKSGSGKTNLLRTMILQDLKAGNGVGVIAPEQEMITEEILPYIPEERLDDVIYFNPADGEAPVSFNPLHLDEGEDIDLRVDENLTIFKRSIGEGGTGPRMDEILRQGFYALLEREGTTLLDFERLLNREDPTFRNEVIRTSQDETTVRFWRDIYPRFPKEAHLPITNRLSRLTRPRTIRNVLCNPLGCLSFRGAIDTGKILLFNLSDGLLGEANSQLLGQLIVSKFQTAVMSRADVPPDQRRPFYLYIDEFQTFTGGAAASYEKILSRARKYRLSMTLAHQQTGQIPAHLLKEIFGNVSTLISFVVSREDAGRLAGEFLTEREGQITHVPPEEILSLKVGEAWCKISRSTVFLKTYLAPQKPDYQRVQQVIARSRLNFGVPLRKGVPEAEQRAVSARSASGPPSSGTLKDIDPGQVF